MQYDVPYLGALLIAAVVPLVIGLLLAIPFMRLRLRGIYLGMATFGFGEIAFLIFRNWESMTGGSLGMRAIPAPVIFGYEFIDQQPYAYLVIAVLLIAISLVLRLVNTMPGQVLLAVRDDELAASSVGIPTLRYQVAAFGFGAALAGIAGSLFAHYVTYLSPENFTSNISILALTMLIVGGRGNVVGSLVGAALLVILPEALRALPELRILIYGALLMLMATLRPQGILGDLRWGQNLPTWTGVKRCRVVDDQSAEQEGLPDNTLLTTDSLTVAFGGLVAVNAVSLRVRAGEVFGIIGPNGAGKTTMFNALTGFTIPTSGRILFANQDITALPSWKRARMGLARTFQNLRLFPEMTVFQTVLIGRQAGREAGPVAQLLGTRGAREEERACRESQKKSQFHSCRIRVNQNRRAGVNGPADDCG